MPVKVINTTTLDVAQAQEGGGQEKKAHLFRRVALGNGIHD